MCISGHVRPASRQRRCKAMQPLPGRSELSSSLGARGSSFYIFNWVCTLPYPEAQERGMFAVVGFEAVVGLAPQFMGGNTDSQPIVRSAGNCLVLSGADVHREFHRGGELWVLAVLPEFERMASAIG